MGVLDGQAVSAAVTNAAFLNKNSADTMPYNLSIAAALNFPKNVISTAGTINALDSSKVNIKLTGASVILNGITGGLDGEILIIQNSTGSAVVINSLSGSASAGDQIKLVSSSYSMPNDGGAIFIYDNTQTKWVVVATMDSMTATDLNTAGAIVKRDASGNFIASQASLSSLLLRGSSSGTVTVSPPATVTSYALTLPNAQGASQTTLVNDGTGALTWGTVGSGGSKNYFSQSNINPTFETGSVSPWSACTLGFSGGAPTGAPTLTATQMSIATSSSTPLMGTYSMRLTHAAANAQYQGFISGAFTIDREDLAKVMYGSFSYELISGTVDFSGSTTQTLEIWIYNTVSGVWTQPAGYRGMNQGSGQGLVTFSFQTDSTAANNSYRIAVITQQTSTSAYVVAFDDFKIGPSAILVGPVMSDFVSYTPTINWTGGVGTPQGRWKRVGDHIEIFAQVPITGSVTPTATSLTINIPAGLSIDTTKLAAANNTHPLGEWAAIRQTVAYYGGVVVYNGTSNIILQINGSGSFVTNSTPNTWANTDSISVHFLAPITGWSSTTQLSQDTDTRVVAFAANKTATQSIPNNVYTVIDFNSVEINTHGSTYAAGAYTAPVSGYYRASFQFNFSSGTGGTIFALLNKNGSGFARVSTQPFSTSQSGGTGSTVLYLNAGDNVSLSVIQLTGAAQTLEGVGRFSVERLTGPSVIAATETVAEIRENNAGSTIATTITIIPYATTIKSTHGGWDGVNHRWVAPISGTYLVTFTYQHTATALDRPMEITARKSTSVFLMHAHREPLTASTGGAYGDRFAASISTSVPMSAGEYIDFTSQSPNGAVNLYTPSGANRISIIRVGN